MEIFLIFQGNFANAVIRLLFEPLVVVLAICMIIGWPQLRRILQKSHGFGFLLWSAAAIVGLRMVFLFLLGVNGSIRYSAPLLFACLVCSGVILSCGCMNLAVILRQKSIRIRCYQLLGAVLLLYAGISVVKATRSFRPNQRIVNWHRLMAKKVSAFSGKTICLLDQSKRGSQILYFSGVKKCELVSLFGNSRDGLFQEVFFNRKVLQKYPEWWLIAQNSDLSVFKNDYQRYAGNFPFSIDKLDTSYTLLTYYDAGKLFPLLPEKNTIFSRPIESFNSSSEVLLDVKLLLLGDALFSNGKISRALKQKNNSLIQLGGEPVNDQHSPWRREALENLGWRFFLHDQRSRLCHNGEVDFATYSREYLEGKLPEWIVISLGLSELYGEGSEFTQNAKDSVAAMHILLQKLVEQIPGVKIGVIAPLPPPESESGAYIRHPEFTDYYYRFLQETIDRLNQPQISLIHYHLEGRIYNREKLSPVKRNYQGAITTATAGEIAETILGWMEAQGFEK